MNSHYLNWHPKFTVAKASSSKVFLSSSSTNFILDIAQLPFIRFIDGNMTASQIEQKLENAYDKSSFHYYLDYMRSAGLIYEAHKKALEACIPSIKIMQPQQSTNLSPIFDALNIQAIVLTKNIAEINPKKFSKLSPFIIIEDFYDSFVVSPVLSLDNKAQINAYLAARLQNLPLIQFISNHAARIKPYYSQYNEQSLTISDSLLNHLAIDHKCTVITNEQNIESYIVPDYLTSKHDDQAIQLQDTPITSDKDGGSRVVSAQATVDKILPYVNRYTGLINQLSLLTDSSSPIKIYRTAFYKQGCHSFETAAIDGFNQTCLGKGVAAIQSQASALCEALERNNAQFKKSDTGIFSAPQALNKPYYLFDHLAPYSKTQYLQFNDPTHTESTRHQAVTPYNNKEIHWQPCWSLTHQKATYIPSVLCFANTPFIESEYGRWNSNGCATGNTIEEAILQAAFELIERDACAIWWYNQIRRPSFDLTRIESQYLSPLHQTLDKTHHYWVLDITNDLGIPVMAAIGKDKKTNGWIFGFGCHFKAELAAQRALSELCQLIPIRNQNSAPFNFDAVIGGDYLNIQNTERAQPYLLESACNLKSDILNIVEHLKGFELDVVTLDYKRSESPMHTAKVFVPGLCHIWPQLGNPRLYNTPVKLGWLDEPLTEATINQQGLYI
ncbi:YcaO-like family protein [Pseudoalteromonas sp. JBTF-M23]|uniref:YcaO-like family protein n=1 Tax=Pseudoalteromonas caenipelagi TaxID=2726988 RepID=A0A849VA96_9GAMM|nr:YcaO-like family protein [Pseudoalteromonas caenipelagi]NOU49855.1 YcaO-like family protein [Pseudoalteromonas caenipelagi]